MSSRLTQFKNKFLKTDFVTEFFVFFLIVIFLVSLTNFIGTLRYFSGFGYLSYSDPIILYIIGIIYTTIVPLAFIFLGIAINQLSEYLPNQKKSGKRAKISGYVAAVFYLVSVPVNFFTEPPIGWTIGALIMYCSFFLITYISSFIMFFSYYPIISDFMVKTGRKKTWTWIYLLFPIANLVYFMVHPANIYTLNSSIYYLTSKFMIFIDIFSMAAQICTILIIIVCLRFASDLFFVLGDRHFLKR